MVLDLSPAPTLNRAVIEDMLNLPFRLIANIRFCKVEWLSSAITVVASTTGSGTHHETDYSQAGELVGKLSNTHAS